MVTRLPIIIGLDAIEDNINLGRKIVEETCGLVEGYKLGLPNILGKPSMGIKLKEGCRKAIYIADLKLADISDTMIRTTRHVIDWADAVIAHSFPGYEGALDNLSNYLASNGRKLVVVVAMSNPGARTTMDTQIEKLVEIAIKAKAWGIVAPATRPEIIKRVRKLYPQAKIL